MTCVLVGKKGSLLPVALARVKMCRRAVESCHGSVQRHCSVMRLEPSVGQVTARTRFQL